MIPNNDVQAALMTRLKASIAITSLLKTSTDIKESQWQGTTFAYPAVRLSLGTQVPESGYSCKASSLPFTVICKDENPSSHNADALAGAVSNTLHGKRWCDIIQGVRFTSIRVTGLRSATREDERTWRAEVDFQAMIVPAASAP